MLTINNWLQPETIEEAYTVLTQNRNNALIGGCAFLKLGSKRIQTGIDLSRLNLGSIEAREGYIEIGCMATLRDMETHPLLKEAFGGMIPKTLKSIVGIQFRNVVTVGASVFSRYGFSDLITALLVLETEVELYKGGRMPLEVYLERKREKDILTRILIKSTGARGAYLSLRNSFNDFSVLNAAVSKQGSQWKIALGARPRTARLAKGASAILTESEISEETVDRAAEMVSQELSYGTNMRASAEYRKAMSSVLVKRGILEVLACR